MEPDLLQSTESVEQRMRNRWLDIVQRGKLYPTASIRVDPECSPEWFDPRAFAHAQKLFNTYETVIRLSQLLGLNLLLYHTDNVIPLLATGNSKTIGKLFTRYLSTMIHVGNWFHQGSDPFDPESRAYKSLKMVRGMHRRVGHKMNTVEGRLEGRDEIWINQYGMSIGQFAFAGLMTVFPKKLGFHNFKSRDFHAMFHFWRVIAYCLGTEDQFNIFSGSDEESFEICRRIYYDTWLPVIREGREVTGIAMTRGISTAMTRVNPLLDYTALMHYAAPFLGLNPKDYPLMTLRQKIIYGLYCYFYRFSSKRRFPNWLSSKFTKASIRRATKKRTAHAQYLDMSYPDVTYANDRCPFDANFNYRGVFDCPTESVVETAEEAKEV